MRFDRQIVCFSVFYGWGEALPGNLIEFSAWADQDPLLAKQLLHYPVSRAPEFEIVNRALRRHAYEERGG